MRRVALFILLAAMLDPVPAEANGRRPTMVDVHFWAAVLELTVETPNLSDPPGMIRVAARADGQTYFAGSPLGGLHISTDFAATWTPTAVSPVTWCMRAGAPWL